VKIVSNLLALTHVSVKAAERTKNENHKVEVFVESKMRSNKKERIDIS